MKDMTSYPLRDPFLSSARIIMSIKFLMMRSCIFFKIFPSNFPPFTMTVNAVMFIHILTFYVIYIYLNLILIPNKK